MAKSVTKTPWLPSFFPLQNHIQSIRMFNKRKIIEIIQNNATVMITLWKNNIDPENNPFLVETNLPTPICQGLCEFTGG